MSPEKIKHIEKLAEKALRLDREVRQPTGGMRTGDMLEVGMRDWYRVLRLAKYIVKEEDDENHDHL